MGIVEGIAAANSPAVVNKLPACFAAPVLPRHAGSAQNDKFFLRTPDGSVQSVSKLHAFAIISGHPRSSKDRSLRVQTMARFVPLQPQLQALEEGAAAVENRR